MRLTNENVVQISVVMAVYNGEKYLEKSVLSILNQTFSDFEFIIINDGSTDRTSLILEQFAKADKRIRICHQENSGLPASLNRGFALSKGKYIARMDADDVSLPDRLKVQYIHLEQNKSTLLCHSFINIIDANNKVKSFRHNVGIKLTPLQTRWTLLWCNCIKHPTVMIRRDLLIKNGLKYDSDAVGCEDYAFWCSLSSVSDFSLIKKALLQYRVQAESITHNSGQAHLDKFSDIVSKNLQPYLPQPLDEMQKKELTILSGQTYFKRNYVSYHFAPWFFMGLIESVNHKFVMLNRLDEKQVRELSIACARLCMRWSKTTLLRRTNMAAKFMLGAVHYAILGYKFR